jgi:hypothetical protein
MAYEINHYIPQFILKNFCNIDEKTINLLDIINFKVEKRNVDRAFYKKNFYDIKPSVSEDPKALEKMFGTLLESKLAQIIKRITQDQANFTLTRYELELLKKYIAIQRYRNPSNQSYYSENYKGDVLSKYSIKPDETESDFWKREMMFVLENDWDTIIAQEELIGVRIISQEIYNEYLTFFTTDEEFVISDVNCFTERFNIMIPEEKKEEYYEMSAQFRKSNNMFDAEEGARKEVSKPYQYFDNFTFIVLSPNLAVASVNQIWKQKYLTPEINDHWMIKAIHSPILDDPKNFSLPINDYVNTDKIMNTSDLSKYKDKNDKFSYKLIKLSTNETRHVMTLCLNEARLFVGYRDKRYIKNFIRFYNSLSNESLTNIKNNYGGYISLIDAL